MCGIIGVVRRRDDRNDLNCDVIRAALDAVGHSLSTNVDDSRLAEAVGAAASTLASLDLELRSMPGVRALVSDHTLVTEVALKIDAIGATMNAIEARLDAGRLDLSGRQVEDVNAALVPLKDAVWAVSRDRLRAARSIAELAGPGADASVVAGYWSVHVALSAIDRLEVRGRDSAGIEVSVSKHGIDPDDLRNATAAQGRLMDGSFRSGSIRSDGERLVFVYKTAAEIGELGDNTAAIRAQVENDDLLRVAMSSVDAEVVVLGHTRWASVGIISEANAHPLDSTELERSGSQTGPLVTAVLNGDVDNFGDLKALHGLAIPPEITTDAKVIPTLVSRGVGDGQEPLEAFRSSVASFEGSVAIGCLTSADPDKMLLALRGSGQALYVGIAEDAFIVASEPYGVVEEATSYLRMDGETPANLANPVGSQGQIVSLSAAKAGSIDGIDRIAYDGTRLDVTADELTVPEITTRDIDLGDAPHFFLKEVTEAPTSFRKTLRGRIVETEHGLEERLGDLTIPASVRERLSSGAISRVLAI
ncbi:MAG: glucosamine-6-phosphate synthase, partial [Actinomycetota bacterium]|nr:glucosamine-6-phosphate synthase [Actinomycetota bacterium]